MKTWNVNCSDPQKSLSRRKESLTGKNQNDSSVSEMEIPGQYQVNTGKDGYF